MVLGGGLLGCEAARGVAGRKVRVPLLHAVAHLMERRLDPGDGAVPAGSLRRLGIEVHLGVAATAWEPGAGARCADGSPVAADAVVVGVGARRLPVAGSWMKLRGYAVLVDGRLHTVPPAGMALLRCLAHCPGRVVGRADLLRALPGGGDDEHAVATAMARLRTSLGWPRLVQTVITRGYRLALDPPGGGRR